MAITEEQQARYLDVENRRADCTTAVVTSRSPKRIVVAGPGTGKTFLFKEILKNKQTALTLTFVNSLVEDLALELYGLSDVKTLHGFARGAVSAATRADVKISPFVTKIIQDDAQVILETRPNFDRMFHRREHDLEVMAFYQQRRHQYDNTFGYADVIENAVSTYERDIELVPAFDQVIVDEFQDFNQLEVTLIDLLAKRSPILLAGDDDQALYDFKDASTEHIRSRYNDPAHEFAVFTLPYCSRSPRVIVDAANDIIRAAQRTGHLAGRIDKQYLYYECEEKDEVGRQNPQIIYARKFDAQIPWFIETQIKEIAKIERRKFEVLVISPTNNQSKRIAKGLKGKGLAGARIVAKRENSIASLLDGLKLLLRNPKSNLGWRICAPFVDGGNIAEIVLASHAQPEVPFRELLRQEDQRTIRALLTSLRRVRDHQEIGRDETTTLLNNIGVDPEEIAVANLADELRDASINDPAVRQIPISFSTIQGSKGLAADYVFITHCDNRYLIKEADHTDPSDQDVCGFLVALTRARKRVFIVSTGDRPPLFVRWIGEQRVRTM